MALFRCKKITASKISFGISGKAVSERCCMDSHSRPRLKCTYLPQVSFVIVYIYIFIAIALDESIFLDVLHFPMKNIKSRDLEATPMGGATSKPIQ